MQSVLSLQAIPAFLLARNLYILGNLLISSFISLGIQKRDCFHPGASVLSREDINLGDAKPVSGTDMIRGMLEYVWPKVSLCFFLLG